MPSHRPIFCTLIGLWLGLGATWGQAPCSTLPLARYWVTLRDKNGISFDTKHYFTPQARARRARQHLPAYEATDLPVRADYLAALAARVDSVTLVSRWLNGVACRATAAQAATLRTLPGVRTVQLWPPRTAEVACVMPSAIRALTPAMPGFKPKPITANDFLLARRQTAHLDGAALRGAGLDGRGMRIAVFDVGFGGLLEHPAFGELVASKRIVATRDFLKNRTDVFHSGNHGTEVMGCLAGRLPGSGGLPGFALGLAPAAEYLLARTEQLHREHYGEEEAWLAAVEWADRLGADVINSSLAYTEQRYFPEQMDGHRSLIARAANLAVRKGMLVVSAAGNDGDDDWVRIGTPADADSVLAIGGLDPETGLHAGFSSFGPTADRRPKPNLVAFGTVLTTTPDGYERLEGTSFAAPLVAGFAACMWQQTPQLTAMQLFRKLEKSAELYPYFDYAHGYGRPRYGRFAAPPKSAPAATFDFVLHDSLVAIVIRRESALRSAEMLPLMTEQSEVLPLDNALVASGPAPVVGPVPPVGHEEPAAAGSAPLAALPEPNYPAYLYWNLADRRGVLRRYETRAVTQRLVVQVPRRLLRNGDVLQVYFKGYTGTYSE